MTKNKQRWLGIDFGSRRIGVAISDPLGFLARRLETISWNGRDMDWTIARLAELVRSEQITGVVVGLPRRTDGRTGESELLARAFAQALQDATGLVPVLRDERYTTVLAGRIMRETKVASADRKKVVDQIAAEIILQDYLDSRR
ncbi:MAG: Holliday junction resolvase RuvX [Clostridia bacterium]|nr:Holliday junction resolvase RuvX [Clostridia bacterium]